ncbi:BlaI/MecI/CopY family transcriptional regulator [Streptomyces armeniacus]|uniref:BlaI/MecI/CopY family transcriptional regulator n=1 Tax=Streptomyces armeniacus TaxID=83291 RepID=UPI001FE379BC|nr:BlaI/MecI/CopY family transcriptional regulator [Streptomyces armeniacus]
MVLGALESEVMGVLWQAPGALTVREVLDALNEGRSEELAYTTVMTVLTRLTTKGVLSRSRRGRGFAYTPLAEDEAGAAVQEVLNRYGDAAVAHFLHASAASPTAKERLRRLLEDG